MELQAMQKRCSNEDVVGVIVMEAMITLHEDKMFRRMENKEKRIGKIHDHEKAA